MCIRVVSSYVNMSNNMYAYVQSTCVYFAKSLIAKLSSFCVIYYCLLCIASSVDLNWHCSLQFHHLIYKKKKKKKKEKEE